MKSTISRYWLFGMHDHQGLPAARTGRACTRNFPKAFLQSTEQGADSYPKYRRRSPEDGGHTGTKRAGRTAQQEVTNVWVVPYNPYLIRQFISMVICAVVSRASNTFWSTFTKGQIRQFSNFSKHTHKEMSQIGPLLTRSHAFKMHAMLEAAKKIGGSSSSRCTNVSLQSSNWQCISRTAKRYTSAKVMPNSEPRTLHPPQLSRLSSSFAQRTSMRLRSNIPNCRNFSRGTKPGKCGAQGSMELLLDACTPSVHARESATTSGCYSLKWQDLSHLMTSSV